MNYKTINLKNQNRETVNINQINVDYLKNIKTDYK